MIRKSVFGSDNEKELFKTLHSNWSDKFDLWPNLPFTNIIDINAIGDFELPDKVKEFLYKTTVDYTLCKKDGNPLLSIEFDGMGHGFSKNGEYIQLVPTKDGYRKLKLDLKLKVANLLGYPLFVVSYDEKEPIGPGLHLTIVDGIIGMTLALKYWHYLLAKLNSDEKLEYTLSTLSKYERDEYIDDLALNAEVEADIKWNPISSLASKYELEALDKKLIKNIRWDTPEVKNIYDNSESYLKDLESLAEKRKSATRVGAKVIIDTLFGEISSGDVWVRNIQGYGVDGYTLAIKIAELLAYKKVLDSYSKGDSHD